MPYIPVDLTTPWLAYWGALVLVVVPYMVRMMRQPPE